MQQNGTYQNSRIEKKKRRSFTWEFKKKLIEDYYGGKITAAELASKHDLHVNEIYKWKYELEGRRKKERQSELKDEGRSPEDIRRIMHLEEELSEYKKKVGEMSFEIDLLKKLHPSLQQAKSISGLEKIRKELGLSKGRVK